MNRETEPKHLDDGSPSESLFGFTPRSLVASALVVAGFLVLGGGCTSQSHSQTQSRNQSAASSRGGPGDPDGLDEAVQLLRGVDAVQASTRWETGQARLVRCMRSKGFGYLPVPAPIEVSVVRNPAWRREHGYGFVDGLRSAREASLVDPNSERIAKMSAQHQAAIRVALQGDVVTGTKGCVEEAFAGLAPSVAVLNDVERIRAQMRADVRWVVLEQTWRSCMTISGFGAVASFDDPGVRPLQLERLRLARVSGPSRGERLDLLFGYELRLSAADLRCREQVQSRLDKVTRDYARQLLGANVTAGVPSVG